MWADFVSVVFNDLAEKPATAVESSLADPPLALGVHIGEDRALSFPSIAPHIHKRMPCRTPSCAATRKSSPRDYRSEVASTLAL